MDQILLDLNYRLDCHWVAHRGIRRRGGLRRIRLGRWTHRLEDLREIRHLPMSRRVHRSHHARPRRAAER